MRKLKASIFTKTPLVTFYESKRATNNKHLHSNIEILYYATKLQIKACEDNKEMCFLPSIS